jgi:hypothetical protein
MLDSLLTTGQVCQVTALEGEPASSFCRGAALAAAVEAAVRAASVRGTVRKEAGCALVGGGDAAVCDVAEMDRERGRIDGAAGARRGGGSSGRDERWRRRTATPRTKKTTRMGERPLGLGALPQRPRHRLAAATTAQCRRPARHGRRRGCCSRSSSSSTNLPGRHAALRAAPIPAPEKVVVSLW